MGFYSETTIPAEQESERTDTLTAMAEQQDDKRQQAEAEEAQQLLKQMNATSDTSDTSTDEADKKAKEEADEAKKRQAHEEAEAKRKAEWEAKKLAREEEEQAAWESAVAMDDDQLLSVSVKRLGDDAERITRRNMKQCVTEFIQTHCYEDMDFARQVMHPRKSMIRCFRYINRKAKEFVQQEMKDNDIKPDAQGYGSDVPDDLCYQWALEYFMDMEAEEDQENEEKFVPKPYSGKSAPKSKKKPEKKKTEADKNVSKSAEKTPGATSNQMTLFQMAEGAA